MPLLRSHSLPSSQISLFPSLCLLFHLAMSRVNNLRPSAIIRLPTRLFFSLFTLDPSPLLLLKPALHTLRRLIDLTLIFVRATTCVFMSMSKAFRRAPFISLTPVGHPLPPSPFPTAMPLGVHFDCLRFGP